MMRPKDVMNRKPLTAFQRQEANRLLEDLKKAAKVNLKRLIQEFLINCGEIVSLENGFKVPLTLEVLMKEHTGSMADHLFNPDHQHAKSYLLYLKPKNNAPKINTLEHIAVVPQKIRRDIISQFFEDLKKAFIELEKTLTTEHPLYLDILNGIKVNDERWEREQRTHPAQVIPEFRAKYMSLVRACSNKQQTAFLITKERQKKLKTKLSLLQTLLQDTNENNKNNELLLNIKNAFQFLDFLSTIHIKFDLHSNEFIKDVEIYYLNFTTLGEGDDEKFIINKEFLREEYFDKSVEYFYEMENKYDIFYRDNAKDLQSKRNELLALKKAAVEAQKVVATPVAISQLSETASSTSASMTLQYNTQKQDLISDTPPKPLKRYQMPTEGQGASSSSSSSTTPVITTFAGMQIDPTLTNVAVIRKTGNGITKYFYLDESNLDDSAIDLNMFTNISVKHAGDRNESGLKSLKDSQNPPEITCLINGVKHQAQIRYELKHKHPNNTDRILCVEIPCDQKDVHASLIVGLIGVPDGYHDDAQIKIDTIKVYALNPPKNRQSGPIHEQNASASASSSSSSVSFKGKK